MKITVTFDSYEEFMNSMHPEGEFAYIRKAPEPAPAAEAQRDAAKKQQEAPKPEKEEEPVEAPEVPFKEDKPEAPAVTTEQVRKILADLNKKAGKNAAKELIKQVGYKKLTDVPEGALPTLKALAEEEARAYA